MYQRGKMRRNIARCNFHELRVLLSQCDIQKRLVQGKKLVSFHIDRLNEKRIGVFIFIGVLLLDNTNNKK